MRRLPPTSAARARRVGGLSVAVIAALATPLAAAPASPSSGTGVSAPSGLAYSTASPHVVQRQPPGGSCRARGAGIYSRPDPRCTPGALNPAVTQATIGSTICHSGWTSTVRPRESITEPEKLGSMRAYGDRGRPSSYEYDHEVPLELGGALNDPRNLWPEPDYPGVSRSFYLNPKDKVERTLNRLVCAGKMPLSRAQRLIASDWVSAAGATSP